jgi:pyridoxamine 5'-phosphate oxidase
MGNQAPITGGLGALRRDYGTSGRLLRKADLAPSWWEQVDRWLAEAIVDERQDQPQAVVLATASPEGIPSIRTVLLKSVGSDGLVFATNRASAKGHDLEANPRAALCLSWVALERQIVISGSVEQVSEAESDEIFAARPRGAQVAAWASEQSAVIGSREELEQRRAQAVTRFPGTVPRPADWGGYRVVPVSVELWQGQADRFHDRLRYRVEGDTWIVERLQP